MKRHGKPAKFTAPINIRVPKSEKTAMLAKCQRIDRPLSWYIRDLIQRDLAAK